MAVIFGVDSQTPAHTRLTNGYTLYDWVVRQSCFPSFWGRDMAGEHGVDREEIDFLREKQCKIALLHTNLTECGVSTTDGTEDARKAVQAAQMLDVAPFEGIALFAKLGDMWTVSERWLIGFARVVFENGYIPGFMANTDSSKNFSFDRNFSRYIHMTQYVENYKALVWSTEPQHNESPREWTPYYPSAIRAENVGFWNTASNRIYFEGYSVNEDYAHDSTLLNCCY